MSKKVTMEDIAKKLGITKNTVSLALRNMPGINEKTRELIFETAKKNGYNYKKKGYNTTKEKDSISKNICLMLSDDTRNSVGFFSFIQYGIESEAKKNHLNTILYCFDENKKFEPPVCIKDDIISGIITLGRVTRKTIESITRLNLPLVIVDHFFDDIKASYILSDNVSGGYIATEYLIKSGHRDIGFFGNVFSSTSFYDRYLGYLKALGQYKIPVNPSFSIMDDSMADLLNNGLELVVKAMRKITKLPTAMFCCNDIEAIAILKALSAMGMNVPDDISIVGFDNIESSKSVTPELTTMHISKELMGERAVKKLISKMNEEEYPEEKILLPAHLVERQSVRQIGVPNRPD
ncbi:MAG: LacI family DNA-binding transcriptional regulator [Bacillota bacterium]